jgi:hypothetical protein
MRKGRKLDAATEQQAVAFARKHLEFGVDCSHDWEIWRAARKHELCEQLELPGGLIRKYQEMHSRLAQIEARFVSADLYRRVTHARRTLKALFANMDTSFASPPMTIDKEALARLIADAERGNPHAAQVLRELAAEYLQTGGSPPKPLADYAAKCLRAPSARKQTSQQRLQRPKRTNDRHLAQVVHAVSQKFNLKPTRNRDPKNTKNDYRSDCACSIVAKAVKKSEHSLRQIWEQNKDFVRSTACDVVTDTELINLEHELDQIMPGKTSDH